MGVWEIAAGMLSFGYGFILVFAFLIYRKTGVESSRRVTLIAMANASIPWMIYWAFTAAGTHTLSEPWRWVARGFHIATLASFGVSLWLLYTYFEKVDGSGGG